MRTNHVDILLPEYVRGTLGSDDIGIVEEHLRECETCRSEAEEIRRTFTALHQSTANDVPASYFSSVLPRVRQRIDQRSRDVWSDHPLITRILLPTGAAALLIALLWLVPLRNNAVGHETSLQAVVDSASSEEIAEILQQDIPSHEWKSFSDTVITGALADDQFVGRRLVQEALANEANSPFELFSDVSPQQMLSSLDEKETAQILQRLNTETL